jgi:flagellar hook protein FlgE
MKTRMQPIGNVWNKFPRVVRDLATSCGKQVRIELEGSDTELDKTIIEAIKDPLTQMILAQRSYEANSRVVRAADEMFQQVNSMTR